MTDDRMDEERLRELRALTDRLPRQIEPPAEAWTAILSQIERDETGPRGARAARPTHVWQRPAFLLAASLALVASSSSLTYVVLRARTAPAVAATAPAQPAAAAATTVSSLTRFTGKENEYLRRVNGLVAIMESGEVELAPETIAKVKESLAVIDAAILEARAALARDPANRELIEMLESTYEKKLDLLQRTTEMARS